MVTAVKFQQPLIRNTHCKGMVVEIIGPAGAGKSTLFNALGELDQGILRESLPPVWDFSYIPFFVGNIISLIPTLIHMLGIGGRGPTREELAWMAMLNGWPKLLKSQILKRNNVILLDQGPIFLMGTLYGFGPPSFQNVEMEGWWEKIMACWMEVLDIIVWLDASDEILTTRIRKRDQSHSIKEACDQDVHQFLAQWREVYDLVINRISINNQKLRVVGIDTGQVPIDGIITKVITEIDNRTCAPLVIP